MTTYRGLATFGATTEPVVDLSQPSQAGVPLQSGHGRLRYDILFGLMVFSETGEVRDARCAEALDLLETKRLPDGGFPAEHRYYRTTRAMVPSQRSLVDWGGVSRRLLNPWVSARATAVLHAAGRSVEPGSSTL